MALELRLLGPFTAVYDGRPLDTFRSNKTQALLAYLVTEAAFANEEQTPAHQRDQLMTLLWPRTPQKPAQVNLRQTLYQLRRAIPEVAGPDGASGPDRTSGSDWNRVPFLLSDRQHVHVNPDARYRLDIARFLHILAGDPSPADLAEAISLYRGPFLSDFHLPDSETFEEWAAARRATLQRMALEALETLTEHHLQHAEAEEAERYARRQLAVDELRESGHRQLMRALAQQGNRNAALAHYEQYRALLAEELGVEPSAQIEALYEQTRARESGKRSADARAGTLRLKTFGGLSIELDGEAVADFASRKAEALLVYLACTRREHPREVLAELLWDERTQRQSMANLRVVLSSLRKSVGPYVSITRTAAATDVQANVWLDAAELEAAVAVTRDDEAHSSPTIMQALQNALSLYEGDFLSGFFLQEAAGFETWMAGERERLHRLTLGGLRRVGRWHLGQKDYAEAIAIATRQVQVDPLAEAGHRQLMEALARNGQRAEALAQYETCREILEEEIGVKPAAETEALYDAIREGQIAEAPTPIARKEPKARKKLGRLPSPATPFVGRRREMEELTALLVDGCRLVTLLGPGGSGKTRLAVEFARRHVGKYAHGAAFVDLAPLSDTAAIPAAISTALDFRFTSEGTPREQILNYLANKELLLVLDNFEQLLEGAELVGDLLKAAPGVSLIATSRARLHLGSECLYEIGGLKLPEDGVEAVEMFTEYARRVRPAFKVDEEEIEAVAHICRLVGGMPLAIELAAPWVRYLPPTEIARELAEDLDFLESERADLPERQRSMRAAFDHSWRFLDQDGRDTLMKLSVFRGGGSRRAARAVTGASLRVLVALADHALLTIDPDSGRFAIHELIRQFAMERLENVGEADAIRDAHSAYYLHALAERLPDLKGRDQLGALDDIEGDFENVRAAWHLAVRSGRWQHFPQASQSLFLFALFRAWYRDGIELFEAVLRALAPSAGPKERLVHAYALAGGRELLSYLNREEALAAVPDLQAVVKGLNEPTAIAYCRLMIGQILIYDTVIGEVPSEPMTILDGARSYFQRTQEHLYGAMALWRLGTAYARAGQIEEALDLFRRGLALARKAGDRYVAGALLHNLGSLTWPMEGPSATAESYYQEASDLHWQMGARVQYAFSLAHVAIVRVWWKGDLAQSRTMLEEAVAIAAEQNVPFVRAGTLVRLATHRLLAGAYAKALELTEEVLALTEPGTFDWGLARFVRGIASIAAGDIDEVLPFMQGELSWLIEQADSTWLDGFLTYCGVILARKGDHERAVELFALGLTKSRYRRGLEIDVLINRTRAEMEEALGQEAFAAAWQRGKDLDPMAAAEEVLEMLEALEAAGGE